MRDAYAAHSAGTAAAGAAPLLGLIPPLPTPPAAVEGKRGVAADGPTTLERGPTAPAALEFAAAGAAEEAVGSETPAVATKVAAPRVGTVSAGATAAGAARCLRTGRASVAAPVGCITSK